MVATEGAGEGALEQAMLALLPPDGTPVLNRVLRLMLSRRLERPVDEERYFAARDGLLASGLVGRLRGQGGQLFLVGPGRARAAEAPAAARGEAWPEARLMPALRAFLEGPFRKGLDLPEGGVAVVQDTSASGAGGRWARPDFILASAMRFRVLPGCQVDLHSFELKTEGGGGVLAIHEALAQTRFTHFGHLVWHLPRGARAEALLDDVATHCEEHGIGLVRMHDPPHAGTDGCEILVDPRRKPTLSAAVDGFLESRLTPEQKRALRRVTGEQA